MTYTTYGYGDTPTWGPRTCHPLDPRNDPDDYPEDLEDMEDVPDAGWDFDSYPED